ncbi:MAG: nuclear transport factor 2 family protein [Chloroflexi bacterium]|nr:nuclear transport factor 2 family protein [Chloroflexota bacterium]
MDRSGVQRWLDRYIAAWRANEPEPIEALFTDDVVYRYRPYESYPAAHGIAAVVEAWLDDTRDEPDAWEARYEPYAVDGDRAVAIGFSRYFATADEPEKTYHNAFLLRFAPDGRCSEFTEFYMKEERT